MDNPKLPKPNLIYLLVVVFLGIIAAIALYQAQLRGLIPSNFSLPVVQNQETQIVVQEENTVISVVDKTSPSVVAIGISKKIVNPADPLALPQSTDATIGTGFVVSGKGIIVTNKHVVLNIGPYTVITKDGQKYDVKKVYRDPTLDLAIVQIDGSNIAPLELGDSSKLKVGQTAIAIGNALGKFTNTVTTGIISGLGRKVVAGDYFEGSLESLDDLIQTDAAINPGNSGGPLLNSSGQVIGVNVATTEGAQNIGFAVPINSVKQIVNEFITKGFISRPYLGIQYRFIDKDVAVLNQVPAGVYIQNSVSGGPAEKAGVQSGDIITKINGAAIDSESSVSDIISKTAIGQEITLTIWRDKKEINIKVVIGQSPNQ